MHLCRAAVIGLFALSGAGCLVGFDANRLTGGGRDAVDLGGTTAAGAPADLGLAAGCIDFASSTPGLALPNWIDGRGTWRVIMMAQGKVLAQTTASTSRDDRFSAWQMGQDYTDATVSAVATVGEASDMNCVLARVQDVSNYYALCLHDVGGHSSTPGHQWRLLRMSADVANELASGDVTVTSSHTFALRVQGATLTATVDGDVKPAVTDASYTQGSLGVSTDVEGDFTSLCMVTQ